MDTKEDVTQVSLPGAGGTEPTIIEVLNRNIVGGDSTGASASGSSASDPVPEVNTGESPVTTETNKSDKPVESTTNKESVTVEENSTEASDSVDNVNVLEIESHLIESSELSDTSGVKVEEVPPATEELSKPSTVESETSPKTVIEVEPSTPKLLKPLESEVHVNKQESKLSFTNNPTTEATIKLLEEEKQKSSSHIEDLHKENLKQDQSAVLVEREVKISASNPVSSSEKVSIDKPPISTATDKIEENTENSNTNEQIIVNSNKGSPLETLESADLSKESSFISNAKQEIKKQVKEEVSLENKNYQPLNANLADVIEQLNENHAEIKLIEEEPQPKNSPDLESKPHLSINGLPVSTSKAEEEAKKNFLDSIPQLNETDTDPLSIQAKKERYQSLRDYLHQQEIRPPVPLQTYRWEDLRRAKQQGGYPWTHLYKRPLGPDEEPEIVLLLRKSQELQQLSESPRSLKKVRIHDQVLVKETERYINDLADTEDLTEEETKSCQSISDSASFTASESEEKKTKGGKLRGILKRNRSDKTDPSLKANKAGKSEVSPKKSKCCHPFMDKLRNMADKQLKKRNIKKVPLNGKDKIILAEDQKILKLKQSPKAERSEIPHFIEKQDSDEVVEIIELEESPSKARKRRELLASGQNDSSVLVPDEIIELPLSVKTDEKIKPEDASQPTPEPTVSEILEEEMKSSPPPKAPRKRKEHVYEDIDDKEIEENIDKILEEAVVGALKKSLAAQDQTVMQDLDVKKLDEMGSSVEEEPEKPTMSHLAPISSIDSTSSDEERKVQLPALAEESDQGSNDLTLTETETEVTEILKIVEDHEKELRSVLKREPSPSADKKVTFSHVEDEAEPHREDIELPEQFRSEGRWSKMSDHEYEPIGEPVEESKPKPVAATSKPKPISEPKPLPPKEKSPTPQAIPTFNVSEPMEVDNEATVVPSAPSAQPLQPQERVQKFTEEISAQEQPQEEDHYIPSATTTPRSESRTDHEIHTSQVDSSALEELPLKRENRKKGFMASAQDTSRRMQANLRSQAGKIRTKIRGMKKQPSGSPKAKDRKRFKSPDFSKIKMPEIKRPELPKFKKPDFKKMEFKRPEFTKFQKPDMSKFKIPDRFSSLRIKRSKSLKESDITQETTSATTFESGTTPVKKRFDFNFSTYPRALGRKKKEKLGTQVIARASDLPSTDTAPTSPESSTIPRGPREGGPVGSRWADKFSEFSSVDSESGKYQRYGSEPESYERESSLERRMKDDLEQTSQDEPEQETLQTDEQKQFAEYDEENRAIYQISKTRAKEFKQRRPIVHQDSDVVSEEGKDVGWSDKDILRNKILRGDEQEPEPENFPSEEGLTGSMTNTNQETQSTGSSGILRQKGVIEEIDDDEFFLRKRGISQDNIEIRQYISSAIREGFDTPMNALAQLGDSQTYYPDQFNSDISSEQMNYGYDVPPPKPRRAKHYQYDQRGDSAEISQEFEMEHKDGYEDNISLPHTGSDYFKNFPPTRPLRKPKKQYSEDSQEVPESDVPYFEDDDRMLYKRDEELNDLSGHPQITFSYHETGEFETQKTEAPPQAPKRRRKQLRESVERDEKDSYINGFGGRSISNSYLPNDNQMEEVVVYRTEHEYSIPLAKEETFTSPTPTPRSRRSTSRSRATDDDRTSHGADSMILDSQPSHEDDKFHIEIKENDGYAVVRKEPPPRPPPPTRRKRSPHPLGESQFATMPHLRNGDEPPARPKRNYSTIGPSRPPRRKSSTGMGETQDVILPEYSPYEELDIEDIEERTESPRDLQSGDIINRMKYRPLPPPPRPPRDHRRHRDTADKFDKDEGGEKITFELDENGDYEIDKAVEKCIEVEVSTQTDPLPDDFVCEEFEITDDMKIIEPRSSKTLEDILKKEQEAEIERANQLAEEENLSRSIQRFRESSQRSYSERSKGSTAGRSRSHSRPTTPSAVVIEKRIPTPIPHRANESMLEASLIVRPLDDYDFEDELEAELRRSEDKLEAETVQSDLSSQKQEEEERLIRDYTRDIRDISSTEKEESIPESDIRTEDETEPEAEYEPENFQSVFEGRLRLDLDAELRLKLESIEPESEPEAESTLRDEVTIEPEVKLEQEINLESEARVEEEYIPKVEIKIKHKFEESTQPKVELEPEPKAEVVPEPKVEAVPESKAEVVLEPKSEVIPEPKAEVRSETKYEVPPESKVEILPEPKEKTEPKTKVIPVPEPDPEIDLELEVDIPPPQPPPRRRSYAQPTEETSAVLTEFSPESSITPIAEQPTQAVAPTRLAIADLEVERLNVHALQAGRIMVSELQGASISADDLECKSGSLNVRNLQFPPGFIEEIIERVRNIEREHLQAVQSVPAETQTVETEASKPPIISPPETQSPVSESPPVPELPPARPPPPQPIIPSEYLQYSMPPPAFYQLRNPSDDEHQHSVQMHRRRRHHRRRDSSSDEDSYRERRRSRQGTRSPEPTIGQLGSQLLRACGNSVARSMNQIAHYLQTTQKEGNERNISTAIVLLILMALGILIIGMSGKTIHHHHWDFFNPPGNSNQ